MLERKPAKDGSEPACRKAAEESVAKFVQALPQILTEQERYDRIRKAFDATATGVEKCAENYDPELYLQRENVRNLTPEAQMNIMMGVRQGIFKMRAFIDELQKSPLAEINGTSVIFEACAKRTEEIRMQMPVANAVMKSGPYSIGNIDDDCDTPSASVLDTLRQTLVLAAGHMAGVFLVLDDMISA